MKTFAGRKLGRKPGARKSLLCSLSLSLFQEEKIETTLPKAKELRRYAEKMITLAKGQGISAHRRVAEFIHDHRVHKKIFEVLVPRYQTRKGGYTQIIKKDQRLGDRAAMAVIRLLP